MRTIAFAFAASLAATAIAQDGKIVRMQTLDVRDVVYVLTGASNTLAVMADDGVVLVDTKGPGWGRPILDTIAAVSDRPVTTIVNTHAHADHVGGNTEFPTATRIVAHANARTRMAAMDAFRGGGAKFLPNTIVTDRVSLSSGPDRMELYYFGRGHTDGDLVVVFPEKRLAHLGDLFTAKAAPVIDRASGGSGVAYPETLGRIVTELQNVTRVTSGHDPTAAVMGTVEASVITSMGRALAWRELQEFAEFNRDFLEAVRQAIATGKTAEEAVATLRLPDRYKDYDMAQAPANVRAIYDELGK